MNAPQLSDRPVMEMIMVPDSSSMAAVGVCRVHVTPDPVYNAMLFTARLAVSVIQIEPDDAHTNPYGLYGNETAPARVVPVAAAVGTPVPAVSELRPPVEGYGEVDESVYMSAVFGTPTRSHPHCIRNMPSQSPRCSP